MKKYLFILLALFGLNAFADMHTGMDHMYDMVDSSGESGFTGSFSLRYKPMGFDEKDIEDLTYRARLGWNGDVNEAVQWNVSLSTETEQNFSAIGLSNIKLEQAYITYTPMEGLSVYAGKYGWMPDFHKKGILYSEQNYYEGAFIKYKHMMDDNHVYVKVAAYKLDEGENKPLADGVTVKGKLGGSFGVADGMTLGAYVSGSHDGLVKEEGHTAKTLAKAGMNFSTSAMPVPVSVFATYLTDANSVGEFKSYIGGVSVGKAGKANSTEVGDFGLAVNYYDIQESDYTVEWLNEDYVASAGNGVAVRAQYNPWDNTSFVVKYAHNLAGGDNADNVVVESMFVF